MDFHKASPADLRFLTEADSKTRAGAELPLEDTDEETFETLEIPRNARPVFSQILTQAPPVFSPGPSAQPDPNAFLSQQLEPIDCDNALDFHNAFWPALEPWLWQSRTLAQLSGYATGDVESGEPPLKPTPENPLLYTLVAANGSGKSAMILARYALWYIATKTNSKAVVTSNSFSQLKNMTFRAIHRAAEDINSFLNEKRFVCTEVTVFCPKTRSTIFGFATDQPGRAEGFHPDLGGEMCVLIDEAKSIDDTMFEAFSRFTGFSQWIEVSSPGPMSGHFYKRTAHAQQIGNRDRNDVLQLNKIYKRHVTAFECPAISPAHIEQFRILHGETSIAYKSSILAEFTSLEDAAVIKQEKTLYQSPPFNTLNQPKRAGLDLSLGGDETVLCIVHGNMLVAKYVWNISDSAILRDKCIAAFKEHNLEPANIYADGGGLGKVVIQMIRAAKWEINSVNNESAALYKKEFLNRGMEMYWKVSRLVEERVLLLPHDDTLLMYQLTTRRCEYRNGKLKLQSKQELSDSPDRADAYVLAYAGLPLDEVLELWQSVSNPDQPQTKSGRIDAPNLTLDDALAYIRQRRNEEKTVPQFTFNTPSGQITAMRMRNLYGTVTYGRPSGRFKTQNSLRRLGLK